MPRERANDPLRVAVCGSGMRSRSVWQRHLREQPGLELVGVQDPSAESLAKAIDGGTVASGETFAELGDMLDATEPDALLVAPIVEAHARAAETALERGHHVLVEKPLATKLDEAEALVTLARENDLRLGAVQNWRTKSVGQALREAIGEGRIGSVSHVFFRYLRDRELPHLPDYLYDEADPILNAMSIHHFDLFRFALGEEIVRVQAHGKTPAWSRYRHESVLGVWMETDAGTAISYAATFSSRGASLPLESLQVEGELGTLSNESDYSEPPLLLFRRDAEPEDLTADVSARDKDAQYELGDVEILRNFAAAVRGEEALVASGEDNLGTLAAIEAVSLSLREGRAVEVAR